jgi:hypothetical protein
MTAGWNFERRRDATTRFLIGVSLLVNALPDRETNLEAVRSRMRLSPEEALFAARRLHDDHLLVFGGGPVRSTARGIARAGEWMEAVRAKAQRFDVATQTLREGGTPLVLLAAVIRADGGALACGAPETDPDASYRLAIVEGDVVVERRHADGAFEVVARESLP